MKGKPSENKKLLEKADELLKQIEVKKMVLDRESLQKIREEANHFVAETNKNWARAYTNLAVAADHLDAMLARSEEMCEKEEMQPPKA